MTINLTVKATVVDIRADTPSYNDTFLVDTNVWYWMLYARASLAECGSNAVCTVGIM